MMMTKSSYGNAASSSFYRYQPASYVAGANALQQSFNNNNNKTPATPANTPVDYFEGNNKQQELTLEQLPESEVINGKFIMRGRVSKWFEQRGFGFIENGLGEHQQQFFVHARDLITVNGGYKTLYLGQAVEFEPEQTENGGHAMNVCALGGAPLQNNNATATTTLSVLEQHSLKAASQQQQQPVQQRPLPAYTEAVEAVIVQEQSHNPTSTIIAPRVEADNQQQKEVTNTSTSPTFVAVTGEDGEEHLINLPLPRVVGQVAHWTVDKGYGFVEVAGQEEHFFTHIKDFTCAKSHQSPAMPQAGDFVEFTPSFASNRKRATFVTLPNSVPFEPNAVSTTTTTIIAAAAPQPVVIAAPVAPQQVEAPKKKAHLSSLAKAFALPEKKTVSLF